MNDTNIRPLLNQIRTQLKAHYGARLAGLYLFGSYARGDARAESDVDLLAVIDDEAMSPYAELDTLSVMLYDMELAFDTSIGLIPASKPAFDKLNSPLFLSVRREGKSLL